MNIGNLFGYTVTYSTKDSNIMLKKGKCTVTYSKTGKLLGKCNCELQDLEDANVIIKSNLARILRIVKENT